jgi:hypothetical protein
MAGGSDRFSTTVLVEAVPMSMRAFLLMVMVVAMRLLRLDQVEVRTVITMMTMEKGRKAVSLRTRVKEKASARPGIREYRPPSPRSRDPSHANRWQTLWRRIDCSDRFSSGSGRGVIR